jgi:hypothetical protein
VTGASAGQDVPNMIARPVLLPIWSLAPDAAKEVVNQGVDEGEV